MAHEPAISEGVAQHLSSSVKGKPMAFFFQNDGANSRPERPQHDSPGQRPGYSAIIAIQRCKRATIPRQPCTRPVVAQVAKPAVGRPSFGSPASKPACRGNDWRDRSFPLTVRGKGRDRGTRATIFNSDFGFRISLLLLALSCLTLPAAPKKLAPIISVNPDGHLLYDLDDHGNGVPDFSTCGYAEGNQPIPGAPVRVVVSPVAGDETARIQKAIDYVSGLPADAYGLRGAVLLLKGRHAVLGGLTIRQSGVVLRGQGTNENDTVLVAAGQDRRTLLRLMGRNDLSTRSDPGWQIADDYVPVGTLSFHVRNAAGLKPGDAIEIIRPGTKAWFDALGTTEFGGGLGDWRLVWHPGNYDLVWHRIITKVDGNQLWIESPITTAMETHFGGGVVKTCVWPGRLQHVGVENLRLESTFDALNPKDEDHAWFAVTMENTADAWVRNVVFSHFAGSAVALYETCQRVTVADCVSLAPVSENAGWRRNTFFTMGQQTLFLRCRAENGRHDLSVGHWRRPQRLCAM